MQHNLNEIPVRVIRDTVNAKMTDTNGWSMLKIMDEIGDMTNQNSITGDAYTNKQFVRDFIIGKTGANKWII